MFETALLKRVRAHAGVIAVAGTVNGKPAIDFDERKGDEDSAFPAAIQSLIAPGKNYNQDGAMGTRQARVRWECFGLTTDQAFDLAEAIIAAVEPAAEFGGVRFGRGFLIFERPFPPETIGARNIYRRLIDMDITATI